MPLYEDIFYNTSISHWLNQSEQEHTGLYERLLKMKVIWLKIQVVFVKLIAEETYARKIWILINLVYCR